MGPAACCQKSYLRLASLEPWGYPARPQAAILSLKFPTGNKNQAELTRTYRVLFAIGWTFWIFWSAFGKDGNPSASYMSFVTNWTAVLMGSYAWVALISTLLPRIRRLDTAAWVLHGIAAPLTVMVTILFWATYKPPTEGGDVGDLPSNPTTWHTHGVNAVLMLMDLALSRYPYHLKHFPTPLAFIVSYLCFNFAYWSETRTVVYPSLNYDKPIGAIIMISMTIFGLLPAAHFLLWRFELGCFALSERLRVRAALHEFWEAKGQDVEEGAPPSKGPAIESYELTDAVLATRRAHAFDEVAEVQTPSTTGSSGLGVSGSGSIIGGDVKEAVPVAAF